MFRSLISITSFAVTVAGQAQSDHPLPCPAPQASAFDFIVGEWEGKLYELKNADSTFNGITAVVTTTKILNGCALEERWHFADHGAPESDVVILRAFDAQSRRWRYSGYSTLNEFFTYVGEPDGPIWRFHFPGLRISWIQTPWGYSEQIARWKDDEQAWVNTRHINYTKRGR